MVESACSKVADRNFAHIKFLRFINTLKIACIYRKANGGKFAEHNDMSNMIEGFKSSNEIKFSTISDTLTTDFEDDGRDTDGATSADRSSTITVSTPKNDNDDVASTLVSEILELAPIEAIAKQERQERSLFPRRCF